MKFQLLQNDKNRNSCMDAGKAIAAYFVIWIHVPFPGVIGKIISVISCFGVPYFFMISGYYCYQPGFPPKHELFAKKRRRIFKLTLICYAVYALDLFLFRMSDVGVQSHIGIGLLELLVLNNPVWTSHQHIWFLLALIYCYVFYELVETVQKREKIYRFVPVLLFVHILIAEGLRLAGIQTPRYLVRNAFLLGFPFFMIGCWIRQHEEIIARVNTAALAIIFGAGVVCSVCEYLILIPDPYLNMYVGTIAIAVSAFIFSVKYPQTAANSLLCKIGREYSMVIYMIHPLIGFVLEGIRKYRYMRWVVPCLTALLSTLAGILFACLKQKVRKHEA